MGYGTQMGPQLQMTLMRRVPDSAPSIEFALTGNNEGLKDLSRRGLASLRDVSSSRGYNLLRWAMYGKKYDTCRFLLHAGCDSEYRSLNRYEPMAKSKALDFLLQEKLSVDAEESMRAVAALGSDWKDDQDFTLLHRCGLGLTSTNLEEAVLEHPQNLDTVDILGRTPLFWAAAKGDHHAVAVLLAHGANPNVMDYQLDPPLSHAATNGHTTCCRLLLEAGADTEPNEPAGIQFSNPLNKAARNGKDPLCVKTLLDFGSDIESSGIGVRTSLIYVAMNNNVSFALLLLEYGPDVNASATSGLTPLTTAIMHNSHDVLRLLLDRWIEYGSCPRLKRPHLLQIVADYTDLETMSILAATDHFRIMYDEDYGMSDCAQRLRDRPDSSEKLEATFRDLVDVINFREPVRVGSPESVMEAGLLGPRRTNTGPNDTSRPTSRSGTESSEAFENALESLDLSSNSDNAAS